VPEVEYATTAKLPVETIWEFVHEMDTWATFVTGYQSHTKENEKDSTWVLKGDVGVLARTVKFAVHIEEWTPPTRVTFTLKGVNEPMQGTGTFVLEKYEEPGTVPALPAAPQPSGFSRLLERIARFFFRARHGDPERAASADAGPAAGTSRLTFRLAVTPGGPMAPMVNALMRPLMQPAAENLANQILATLEKRHGIA
jgi:carbon monoxide dehydrogenase subunit G